MTEPHVTIDQGVLRGRIAVNAAGDSFFKFQGIPYAKPPLGDLRFKAPLPPEKWSGILDATKERDICYSMNPMDNWKISGSENCLFLNVYTKKLENPLRPVLFWIHGGGFTLGSGNEDQYGPEFLLVEDVVLVTINYRLGILGFVNFEDPSLEIPGNAGLKDQVMALKWVQKNISYFGGDPNNVTIFGESAGGASVHLLMLLPQTRGLFHKAIAQSGCAINPWVEGKRSSKLLASAMYLDGADDKTIYKALMEKSVEEIYSIQQKIGEGDLGDLRSFGVVVEKNSKNPLVDQKPIDLLCSGNINQVPLMIGITSNEGMIYEFEKNPNTSDDAVAETAILWFFGYKSDTLEKKAIVEKIKKMYFDGEDYSEKWLSQKYDVFSDCQFLYGIYETIMSHLQHSKAPTYVYRVSIETQLNFFKKFLKIEVPGVCHADELGYLFTTAGGPKVQPGSIEDISVKRIVKLWTNFAKTGNPTPENDDLLKIVWKPATKTQVRFLDIGPNLTMVDDFCTDGIKFWQRLYRESPVGKKRLNCLKK